MTAALTFDPGRLLVLAVIGLAFVLVGIWGIWEAHRDAVARHEQRELLREVRRQP